LMESSLHNLAHCAVCILLYLVASCCLSVSLLKNTKYTGLIVSADRSHVRSHVHCEGVNEYAVHC
jgi:hypothetical protein